jgi:hypothetical protein
MPKYRFQDDLWVILATDDARARRVLSEGYRGCSVRDESKRLKQNSWG